MRLRIKHSGVLYYHQFRSKTKDGILRVHLIDTNDQVADLSIKPLMYSNFVYLYKHIDEMVTVSFPSKVPGGY